MAHASRSKLVPIKRQKISSNNATRTSLSEVLRSDPVKRLFSQPNIVIETVPVSTRTKSNTVLKKSISMDGRNGMSKKLRSQTRPDVSIVPLKSLEADIKEEPTFLPSKREGKSEITLSRIKYKRKECGHYEPCENIVCEVTVQQYVEENKASPLLATHIDQEEIDAPVSKHCKNARCDALSIDHDRCRRALIKLHRCDKVIACDICGLNLRTRKSQMRHRNCIRKEVYRHNETNGAQILKQRMRERELQMIEISKMKRSKPQDPITEFNRALEALTKNEELIVIPKMVLPQQPIITITSIPNSQVNSQQLSNVKDVFGRLLPNIPIVFPSQGIIFGKRLGNEINNSNSPPAKRSRLMDRANASTPVSTGTPQNHFIKVASTPQSNFMQPLTINDWLMSQAHLITSTVQPKSFVTPIRVVPITNIKTQPSLLHQTQGIPRFCIMADNSIKQPNNVESPTATSTITPNVSIKVKPKAAVELATKAAPKIVLRRRHRRKRTIEKHRKSFRCTFCQKSFSTDWYFKMHVARHKGEMRFTCLNCDASFSSRYELKKHRFNDHKDGEVHCDVCGHISICNSALEIHMRSHTGERPFACTDCGSSYRSNTDLKLHQYKRHGLIECTRCKVQLARVPLMEHIALEHGMTKEEAEEEFRRKRYKNGDDSENCDDNKENSEEEADQKKKDGLKGKLIKEEPVEVEASTGDSTAKKNNGAISKKASGKGEATKKQWKDFPRRRSLRRANLANHCPTCDETFENETLLNEHNCSKVRQEIRECNRCGTEFRTDLECSSHRENCEKTALGQSCPSEDTTSSRKDFVKEANKRRAVNQ